jgi:excisionase family DNA binding protein
VTPRAKTGSDYDGKGVVMATPIRSADNVGPRVQLTIPEVCAELSVSRSTFYEWRAKGTAPHCLKLPNGELRVRRTELDRWLQTCEEVA